MHGPFFLPFFSKIPPYSEQPFYPLASDPDTNAVRQHQDGFRPLAPAFPSGAI